MEGGKEDFFDKVFCKSKCLFNVLFSHLFKDLEEMGLRDSIVNGVNEKEREFPLYLPTTHLPTCIPIYIYL